MTLIPQDLWQALRTNAVLREMHLARERPEPDPVPVVKLFNPCGAATWLATELDRDGDTLFGLADLGFGCPELGSFSLRELTSVRLPFGLRIERDEGFASDQPLSRWAERARALGSIIAAEAAFRTPTPSPQLPTAPDEGGG